MKATRFLSLLVGLLLAGSLQAQIAVYRDSSEFDDSHARLRDIDFEDVYSLTLQRITFRNPWGLHSMTGEYPDANGNYSDTVDVFLWLGQGATLDFPTRTRTVELDGYANPFYIRVTDFNDSIYTTALTGFPTTVSSDSGIRRVQFLGTDGNGNDDVNWGGGLLGLTTLDANGDTLAHTGFDELKPDHYYLIGHAQLANSFYPDSTMFGPVEWHGVTFTEPNIGFAGTHLVSFEARVDPDNPIGNLALELTPGATIDFPTGVEGALLVLEMVHPRDTFLLEVTDYAGKVDTVMETGWGRTYDTTWVPEQRVTYAHLGFGSSDGIRQIRLLDAWGVFINDDAGGGLPLDTIYEARSAVLAALHLAEAPQNEITGIRSAATDLDTAGFLDETQYVRLHTKLDDAVRAVEMNNRGGAIDLLNAFRSDVQDLAKERVLVSEETKYFLGNAAYVISRLGGVAGVKERSIPHRSLRLDATISADGVRIDYDVPSGSISAIRVYDMRGLAVRTLVPTSVGAIVWDLRDGAGNFLPAGNYLIALTAGGESATRLLQIVR
jgi:hypothetical protein